MNFKSTILLLSLVSLLSSCGTTDAIRYDDRTEVNAVARSETSVQVMKDAHIVHVDSIQRIVTIRSTSALSDGYYLTLNPFNSEEKAALKLIDSGLGPLYTADILEGSPKINHGLFKASEERSLEFDQRYTEATID
tara:strand:- start:113 stop:520 length:408 start_codon:yes stop_codon:yes gene_type:complete